MDSEHHKKKNASPQKLVGNAAAADKLRKDLSGITSEGESGTDSGHISASGTSKRRSARKRI